MKPQDSDLPKLAAPARRALARAGYVRLEQLTAASEAELRQLHGMGPSAIALLREALSERRLAFRDWRPVDVGRREAAVTFVPDARVDAYIDALPDWQRAVCREVRALVHGADPQVSETIKRTRLPYFVLEGTICSLLAAKDHVNVFLYDGGIVPDPEGIITSGHGNKTARTVAIRRGEQINAGALTAMIKAIIANNRAGGWRTLARSD